MRHIVRASQRASVCTCAVATLMPARYVHAIHFKIVELALNVVCAVYVVRFAASQVLACGYALV